MTFLCNTEDNKVLSFASKDSTFYAIFVTDRFKRRQLIHCKEFYNYSSKNASQYESLKNCTRPERNGQKIKYYFTA